MYNFFIDSILFAAFPSFLAGLIRVCRVLYHAQPAVVAYQS